VGQKVAIIGSREWPDYEMVKDYVYSLDEDDVVVSGGARGADQFAEIYARERGLTVLVLRADWDQHGRRAGLIRNHDIINECDRVVAFWDGRSTGTAHSLKLAKEAGKPALIFRTPSANA
jgi:hypothetical protein